MTQQEAISIGTALGLFVWIALEQMGKRSRL